jgi:hypothetical protein
MCSETEHRLAGTGGRLNYRKLMTLDVAGALGVHIRFGLGPWAFDFWAWKPNFSFLFLSFSCPSPTFLLFSFYLHTLTFSFGTKGQVDLLTNPLIFTSAPCLVSFVFSFFFSPCDLLLSSFILSSLPHSREERERARDLG